MIKNLFSELQDLGFDDIGDLNLFNKEQNENNKNTNIEINNEEREKALLYEREITCPVCETHFKAKTVKKEGYKAQHRDSDSFIHYLNVNPYFYDVLICNKCGYAAMESDFYKLKSHQIPSIKENITPKWQGKVYPELYDVNIAIERYKMALLNSVYINAVASRKAMTCLRLGWMYRILEDEDKELAFLQQAAEGFEAAYFDESFPIYKMDKFSVIYLLGELYRRIGNFEKAMSWFSQVILPVEAPPKLKEKARDQKDLIDAALKAQKKANSTEEAADPEGSTKKEGFFSKFFKK